MSHRAHCRHVPVEGEAGGDQAREQLEDPDERDRLATIVVRRIALALDQQEVRKDAAQHPRFDDLAGRPGFDELRRR